MREFSRTLFVLSILLLTTSCVSKYAIRHPDAEIDQERLIFTDNNFQAKVIWKKEIGTLAQAHRMKTGYLVGVGPAMLPDGNVYYQNQDTIFFFDDTTGEIRSRYKKPSGYIAALDHAAIESDKLVVPLVSNSGPRADLLIIDRKTNDSRLIDYGWCSEFMVPVGARIIQAECSSISARLKVYGYESEKVIWELNKPHLRLQSLAVFPNLLIILYIETDSLTANKESYLVETYDLDTGERLWEKQFKRQENSNWHKELWSLKELLLTEYYTEADDFNGKAVSLNPLSGEANWQMSGAIRIYTEHYGDDLFYFYKTKQPHAVYGVDQKSGAKKIELLVKGVHDIHGFISSADKIYYPGVSDAVNPDFKIAQYNTFSALDSKAGNLVWSREFDSQSALPQLKDGILYFGNKEEFARFKAGTLRKYDLVDDVGSKINLSLFLSKSAFAVDAENGKILWKAKLEGTDASYVEKILVKDNIVYIKSLAGWLYAIEWENPRLKK